VKGPKGKDAGGGEGVRWGGQAENFSVLNSV
jgi:hypothetical protein